MKRRIIVLSIAMLSLFSSSAQEYRKSIILDAGLTDTERKYMKFLYDFMPLSDLADYTEVFFLSQVRTTIEAQHYFKWGEVIPSDVFMHFVLPVRVNNENLDSARSVFFQILKERVKNLSMYEAIKEVNHWCHEHVNYKASDGRTSSPLATLQTSWGRCGEESTFAVSALRSVGIPARQCYTPRWAHTDDNHAWVEAWADGKWYYFGACEPLPELNSGWFDSPVKRAMMVHTTTFGKYNGSEQKNYEHELYSKINLLANYTDTKQLKVVVTYVDNKPVKNAEVDFGLYNYAEFYPLARIRTDENGEAMLITGLGDLQIWATDGLRFNSCIARAKDTLCKIIFSNKFELASHIHESQSLDKSLPFFADVESYMQEFTLTPPVEKIVKAQSDEAVAENNRRLAYEDSLREAYVSTFPTTQKLPIHLIHSLNDAHVSTLPKTKQVEWYRTDYLPIIEKSCGNSKEISTFFEYVMQENNNEGSVPETAKAILNNIYEKDLRDITVDVLKDHYDAFNNGRKPSEKYSQETIEKYIINPRIHLEKISSWRSFLQKYFSNQSEEFEKDPQKIADWINSNIKQNTTENYYGVILSPQGIIKTKEADNLSRAVFFIAICRSLGIAARYDWAGGREEYMLPNGDWQYANFDYDLQNTVIPKTRVVITSSALNKTKPEYFTHFALARLVNSRFQTLDFEYDPHFATFPDTLSLINGYYRLLSSNRADDGSVSLREEFFLLQGVDTTLCITLPNTNSDYKVLANIDMKHKFIKINGKKQNLKSLSGKKGLLLMFVNLNDEPTRHLIADFASVKKEFDGLDCGVLALIYGDNSIGDVAKSMYKNFPSQTLFNNSKVSDCHKMLKVVCNALNYDFGGNFPFLIFIKPNGDVVFINEGYRIATPDSILKLINTL